MDFITAINENDEFVYVWQSRPQAAKELGVSVTAISYALNGTFKTCKGYKIRRANISYSDLSKLFNEKEWNVSYTNGEYKYMFS